jgi:hypothetical protein
MREDQQRFLMLLGQLPARLNAEQTAWVLNCQPHDIPGLIAVRLLKPLGNPPANGFKFFATTEVLELSKDKAWLTKMSNAIYNHWRTKNATKKNRFPVRLESGLTSLPVPASASNN